MAAGILMPAGPTLAALWDTTERQYIAISKPFSVEAREVVAAPFEAPSNKASLVVLMENHRLARAADRLEVFLRRSGREIAPALLVPNAQTVYAVWYDLEPGSAELHVIEDGIPEIPFVLALHSGRIGRVSIDMRKAEAILQKPSLLEEIR